MSAKKKRRPDRSHKAANPRRHAKPEPTVSRQGQAIVFLAHGEQIGRTAELVGVARTTLEKWLREDPEFRQKLDEERRLREEVIRSPLSEAQDDALRTLPEVVHEMRALLRSAKKDRDRIRAAEVLWRMAGGELRIRHDVNMTVDFAGVGDDELYAELDRVRAEKAKRQQLRAGNDDPPRVIDVQPVGEGATGAGRDEDQDEEDGDG